MESPTIGNKTPDNASTMNVSTSSSNQLFIADNLDLCDDAFRLSLDNFSDIGENVTIRERDMSLDSAGIFSPETPTLALPTPNLEYPETPLTPSADPFPPIVETPKSTSEQRTPEKIKLPNLLKLSLAKKNDDMFVRPSPVMEVMSPARMLQYEIEATSATPTMKRAVVDFDFFNKNNYEKYFEDEPKINTERKESENVTTEDSKTFEETPVIVNADTVRHEIEYITG